MILTRTAKEFYKNILIVSVIFIIDRISKLYVINLSKLNSDIEIFSSSFLNIISKRSCDCQTNTSKPEIHTYRS